MAAFHQLARGKTAGGVGWREGGREGEEEEEEEEGAAATAGPPGHDAFRHVGDVRAMEEEVHRIVLADAARAAEESRWGSESSAGGSGGDQLRVVGEPRGV